jgi:hypothetical protein
VLGDAAGGAFGGVTAYVIKNDFTAPGVPPDLAAMVEAGAEGAVGAWCWAG